jgi:hypothetical protein
LLLESIHRNTSASAEDIVTYIVTEEENKIDDSVLSFVDDYSHTIKGAMPNPDFPLSAAHGALREAAAYSDNDYLLLLDSDTIVLDDINVHENYNAELYLKPEDIGTRYWARSDSTDDWKELYDRYGIQFPESRVHSTVDNREMLPFFNGGVILTKNNKFPERWLNLSKQLHGKLPASNYYSEMVALALLSSEYEVHKLTERHNYPLHLRLKPYNDCKILHYHRPMCLYRASVFDERSKRYYEDFDLEDRFELPRLRRLAVLRDIYRAKYIDPAQRDPIPNIMKRKAIPILEATGTKKYVKELLKH